MTRTSPLPARRRRAGLALLMVLGAALAFLALGCSGDTGGPAASRVAPKGCDVCHDRATEGPTGMHASFPCEICHLGDPEGTTVLEAHRGLEMEPGALETADRTCGLCHARAVRHVRGSPMATARGLVAVDRWAFGEIPTPNGDETLPEALAATDATPAQDHLKRLCGGCHLNTRRDNRDDIIATGGSGCGACHTRVSDGNGHSTVQGTVPDARCFGCHSRSSRISLSYRGLAEVSGPPTLDCPADTLLADGRPMCRIPADVHHDAGVACTDCHLHTELMGDGNAYLHAEDAVEITCEACHDPVRPGREHTWWEVRDTVTSAILRLRIQWRPDTEPVRLGRHGTPIWNLRPTRGGTGWTLYRKSDGKPLDVTPTPADPDHTLPGHTRLSCAACHTAAAPTCPTCHTRFDPEGEQWDFGAGRVRSGEWIETHAGMGTAPPSLAIGADGRIRPAIPGMVGTLDARAAGGSLRKIELFSVLDPHNTRKEARTCVDCHTQPDVLIRGTGTRVGARPFNAAERARIAQVGTCLPCHQGEEAFYFDFQATVDRLEPGHPAKR